MPSSNYYHESLAVRGHFREVAQLRKLICLFGFMYVAMSPYHCNSEYDLPHKACMPCKFIHFYLFKTFLHIKQITSHLTVELHWLHSAVTIVSLQLASSDRVTALTDQI